MHERPKLPCKNGITTDGLAIHENRRTKESRKPFSTYERVHDFRIRLKKKLYIYDKTCNSVLKNSINTTFAITDYLPVRRDRRNLKNRRKNTGKLLAKFEKFDLNENTKFEKKKNSENISAPLMDPDAVKLR